MQNVMGLHLEDQEKKVPENFEVMKHKWLNKQLTSRQAARELDISQSTFLKWVQESEK